MLTKGDLAASALAKLLNRYPATRDLVEASRRALKAVFPNVEEMPDSQAGLIGYGYGAGYRGVVATLILSRAGVKIGIPYSASFHDPDGMLQGKGKVHRHISISTATGLEKPAVVALLHGALDAWKQRSTGA
jgi:hypothetical protein